MYLAVCDDNIADRKQTERLLGRQSDRIFKDKGQRIYIDSFGNVEAFMKNPLLYNGLFVDMVSGDVSGTDIAKMLLEGGVKNPIIMCSSKLDYKELMEEAGITADNIYYLKKPIAVADLAVLIDMICAQCEKKEPMLELRGTEDTIYAKGDDIICAKRGRSNLKIYLTENRTITLLGDIYNFYDQCAVFPQICPVSDTALINIRHIAQVSFLKVTMDNNMSLPIAFSYRNTIKEARALDAQSTDS